MIFCYLLKYYLYLKYRIKRKPPPKKPPLKGKGTSVAGGGVFMVEKLKGTSKNYPEFNELKRSAKNCHFVPLFAMFKKFRIGELTVP